MPSVLDIPTVAIYGQQVAMDRRGQPVDPSRPNLLKIRNISGVFVGVSEASSIHRCVEIRKIGLRSVPSLCSEKHKKGDEKD